MPIPAHKRYVPILKGKPGEFRGLAALSPETWASFTPLIELPPVPLAWPKDNGPPSPAVSIDAHVAKVASGMLNALPPGASIFVDGAVLEREAPLLDGEHSIAAFLALIGVSLTAIPVVGLRRLSTYLSAVKSRMSVEAKGCCLRLNIKDIVSPTFEIGVSRLLEFLEIQPADVDLNLDIGSIDSESADILAVDLPAAIARIPSVKNWRSFVFSASGVPSSWSSKAPYTAKSFARLEWPLWNKLVHSATPKSRKPAFGDYASTHPDLRVSNPKFINSSPKIKYTSETSWVAAVGQAPVKGKTRKAKAAQVPKSKQVPKQEVQYPRLATAIMNDPAWKGEGYDWAGRRIAECVARQNDRVKATGNSTEWIAVATSHHIMVVVEQLSKLP